MSNRIERINDNIKIDFQYSVLSIFENCILQIEIVLLWYVTLKSFLVYILNLTMLFLIILSLKFKSTFFFEIIIYLIIVLDTIKINLKLNIVIKYITIYLITILNNETQFESVKIQTIKEVKL